MFTLTHKAPTTSSIEERKRANFLARGITQLIGGTRLSSEENPSTHKGTSLFYALPANHGSSLEVTVNGEERFEYLRVINPQIYTTIELSNGYEEISDKLSQAGCDINLMKYDRETHLMVDGPISKNTPVLLSILERMIQRYEKMGR